MVEVQSSIGTILAGPGDENAPIPAMHTVPIANSLVIACQLAKAIISDVSGLGEVDKQVSLNTVKIIDSALENAKRHFPNATFWPV